MRAVGARWRSHGAFTLDVARASVREGVRAHSAQEVPMFAWSLTFFVIALLAAFLGFFGIAASAAGIAKIIFVVALIMAIVSFVVGRKPLER
jgi:uncharacterized membrane protein YtjA (UPF0391 family)